MLDYLIAISLILLTFGHALLIRGCFDINKKLLPLNGQAGALTEKVGGIGTLMDELCDLISELADSGLGSPSRPNTQTQGGIGEMILSSLMSRMNSDESNGPQNQDRTIQETHDTQTQESSSESDELSADLSVG
jgi:hypothetical protein